MREDTPSNAQGALMAIRNRPPVKKTQGKAVPTGIPKRKLGGHKTKTGKLGGSKPVAVSGGKGASKAQAMQHAGEGDDSIDLGGEREGRGGGQHFQIPHNPPENESLLGAKSKAVNTDGELRRAPSGQSQSSRLDAGESGPSSTDRTEGATVEQKPADGLEVEKPTKAAHGEGPKLENAPRTTDGGSLHRTRAPDTQHKTPVESQSFQKATAGMKKGEVASEALHASQGDPELETTVKKAVSAQRESDIQDALQTESKTATVTRGSPSSPPPFSDVPASVNDTEPLDVAELNGEERAKAAKKGVPFVKSDPSGIASQVTPDLHLSVTEMGGVVDAHNPSLGAKDIADDMGAQLDSDSEGEGEEETEEEEEEAG